jgi:hypothetical protein
VGLYAFLFIRVTDVVASRVKKHLCTDRSDIAENASQWPATDTHLSSGALLLCKEDEAHVQQLVHSSQRGTISSEQMRTTPLPFLALTPL